MPISRYEIRNEYSLADPELYRDADKDDPEALLEGVAMSGLVGLLRQLGDLAEFAAEIFHDLHEEVMATAARGHGLMIRVQQLEAEVPSIERAFLSQSDLSSLFYNPGVDWHPNPRLDQNLITQGDLPRFVMDSYEECRGPPRLFLLDKFDVAGAGACLKRFTDPSFFKIEVSSADGQREKKIRKPKKKGSRGRNGNTAVVLPTPHAKLHQLFLEEPVENVVNNPGRHAKLKRRLNGFPFDSRTGKSYMEKVLRTSSPEHEMLHEVHVSSSAMLPTYDHDESGLEVLEVIPVSLDRESVERQRSTPSPPDREGNMVKLSIYEPEEEVSMGEKICEASDISSALEKVAGENDIAVDGENKLEGSLTGYQSDDIASEIDYVDAPSTMGSELDTDSELRVKSDFPSPYIKSQPFISDADENHLPSHSSDSQSSRDSTTSDEGNNLFKKEISSSLSSDSPSTSGENHQLGIFSAGGFLSAGIPEFGLVSASSNQKTEDEDLPVDQHSKLTVSGVCTSPNSVTNHRSDFEKPIPSFHSDDSIPTLTHSDSEVVAQDRFREPKWDETASTSDIEEKRTNLTIDPICSPSVSYSKSLSEDNSVRSSCGEHLVDEIHGENIPSVPVVFDILHHTKDNTVTISADLLPEDDSVQGDLNLVENITPPLDMCDVLSPGREDYPKMSYIENPIPSKPDDEVPNLPEVFQSDYIAHNGDSTTTTVSRGENLIDEVDNEDLTVPSDASFSVSSTKETTLREELKETSLANAQIVEVEDHHSNSTIDSPSHIEISSYWLGAGLDTYDRDIIAEEETMINVTRELGNPTSCEVIESQGTRIAFTPDDLVALASSCSTEDFENHAVSPDTLEKDGVTLCTSTTADPKSLNEEFVVLSDSDSRTDQSETGFMASPMPTVSDNAARDDISLTVGFDKMVEESIPSFENSGLCDHEKGKNSLSESHMESGLVEQDKNHLSESYRELGLMEEVGENEAATSDLDTINDDHFKLEVLHTVPKAYVDLEVESSLDFVDTLQLQPPLKENGLDTNQELSQQSGPGNQLSDAPSSPVNHNHNTEGTILQDENEFPLNQPDQELLVSGEIISELPPINHQKMLDHDECKVHNNSASTFSLVNGPPVVSELLEPSNYDNDVSGYPEDPFGSTIPPNNIFSEANQINLEELPPLPPLPPVQWRMGKLFSRGISSPTTSSDDVYSSPEKMNHPLIQIVPESASKEEKVEYASSSFEPTTIVHETVDLPQKLPHASSATENEITDYKELFPQEISPPIASADDVSASPEETHVLTQISSGTTSKEEKVEYTSSLLETTIVQETIDLPPKLQHASCTTEGEMEKHKELLPPKISPPIASTDDVTSSTEENHSLIQISPYTASKEENGECTSSSSKANSLHETVDLPPKIENEQQQQQQLVIHSSENGFTLPSEEDGVANGNRAVKLPRPRNPLIDEVAALDKSKLRKVTERVMPQTQQVDERDSLLEQIRAKSFNLKPAVQTKPSIRGPNTNLRVAAILEKANAIRQAFAGSDDDEDNDDSWSDS